jgi:hypothetical protein
MTAIDWLPKRPPAACAATSCMAPASMSPLRRSRRHAHYLLTTRFCGRQQRQCRTVATPYQYGPFGEPDLTGGRLRHTGSGWARWASTTTRRGSTPRPWVASCRLIRSGIAMTPISMPMWPTIRQIALIQRAWPEPQLRLPVPGRLLQRFRRWRSLRVGWPPRRSPAGPSVRGRLFRTRLPRLPLSAWAPRQPYSAAHNAGWAVKQGFSVGAPNAILQGAGRYTAMELVGAGVGMAARGVVTVVGAVMGTLGTAASLLFYPSTLGCAGITTC